VNLESVYDGLRGHGYVNQFSSEFRVLRPDLKMVGRARTLRYLPWRPDIAKGLAAAGPTLNSRAAQETEPGDILVVDISGLATAGFLGDVIATCFVTRGGAGIVVDGAVRDWGVLCEMQLPVYAKGIHAAPTGNQIIGADYQIPVQCGGVTVVPGDYILGDPEGIIVLPNALAEEVLTAAEETDAKERFLRKKLEEGHSIYDCYPPNPAILAEYEKSRGRG
jgi:regulator of RNase E activity RraA